MLDLINLGTSGLLGHSKGLRTVGNNLANVNTPGFKSSQLQFSSLVDQGSGGAASNAGTGSGLNTLGNAINFAAGIDQGTGNPLDLRIDGNGFFAVRRDGEVLYTRSGDFRFDDKGVLVNSVGDHVLAFDAEGKLAEVNLTGLNHSMPKATSTVQFAGNLTTTVSTPAVNPTVNGITVIDPSGGSHSLNMSFENRGNGQFAITVTDPAAANKTVGTGTVAFQAGFPTSATSKFTFNYAPEGASAFDVSFDFGNGVTSLASTTTLTALSQDGYGAGVRADQTIGEDGIVNITYSNGQTAKGPRLVLANFRAAEDLKEAGGSAFALKQGGSVQYGYAGVDGYGSLQAGHREGSNVDLAEEFSNLILMQRGYQASSHVISTANDMIQELFDLKGHR